MPSAFTVPGATQDYTEPAANRVIANKLLGSDTQPSFRVMGDGKLQFGPGGGTAPETYLLRESAHWLKTENLHVDYVSAFDVMTRSGQPEQIQMAADGKLYFGSANDTYLFRESAHWLKTENLHVDYIGAFDVMTRQGQPEQIQMAADGKLYFGSAWDTNLYRYAAGALKTDGIFYCANLGIGSVAAAAVPATQNKRFAVYDATGTFQGWCPIYN